MSVKNHSDPIGTSVNNLLVFSLQVREREERSVLVLTVLAIFSSSLTPNFSGNYSFPFKKSFAFTDHSFRELF